jgi:hypothetical protein
MRLAADFHGRNTLLYRWIPESQTVPVEKNTSPAPQAPKRLNYASFWAPVEDVSNIFCFRCLSDSLQQVVERSEDVPVDVAAAQHTALIFPFTYKAPLVSQEKSYISSPLLILFLNDDFVLDGLAPKYSLRTSCFYFYHGSPILEPGFSIYSVIFSFNLAHSSYAGS